MGVIWVKAQRGLLVLWFRHWLGSKEITLTLLFDLEQVTCEMEIIRVFSPTICLFYLEKKQFWAGTVLLYVCTVPWLVPVGVSIKQIINNKCKALGEINGLNVIVVRWHQGDLFPWFSSLDHGSSVCSK